MSWIPLHVHSQFSILDSTASLKALVEKGAQYKMESLALTDQGNLHGAIDFFKLCKEAKIKPLIGCELYVAPELASTDSSSTEKKGGRFDKKRIPHQKPGYPIVLLAKNQTGYKNLCRLSSLAHLEGFYYTPRIDSMLLQECAEGLICLSGPTSSKCAELAIQGDLDNLRKQLLFFKSLFGEDFYLEVLRHQMTKEAMIAEGMEQEPWIWQLALEYSANQEKVLSSFLELGKELQIKCVATNDSRYIERKDWLAHEILMNISSGEAREIWERDSLGNAKARVLNPKRKVAPTHELDFKSPTEMALRFAGVPQVLESSLEIGEKCQFTFDFKSKFYPVFIPPSLREEASSKPKSFSAEEREQAAALFLKQLCEEGIGRRYTKEALAKVGEHYPGQDPLEIVRSRLASELEVILSKGLGDYLLIVYDFIAWAKKEKIPVGPGRGSGVGSMICYLIGITDIEPLRFHLFFERFINPERISYPDIDVDICMDRRAEVIDYTVKTYGKDKVAQIITFGTMKAKMAVKDVGRVLSVPLAKVNEIAKLIPEDPSMTLDKALELDPELRVRYQEDEETTRLLDLAKILEGSVRNTGIHAAGLIISADPLMDHIPLCQSKDESIVVTQFAMKPVEAVGMLKIDFLGLKTLTALQLCSDAIRQSIEKEIPWNTLPLEDLSTFSLLNQGKTLGIFQLESGGMQELAKHLHIDKFEEIIAVNALYRPGPMEMIPSFIDRKHGREKIEFDHPEMASILQETYGIMVYQEQVMMIAQRLAGYSLGEGDVLRRAMGKKDAEEMSRQREKFQKGALARGINNDLAIEIFNKVEKFASYGFNKSHAAAYAYLTYATAYFKANYPLHWMAALMTTDRDDLSKVTKIIRECQTMAIAILPPDVNESGTDFVATKSGIRFALGGIKGLGSSVIEELIKERYKGGPFSSLYDFIKRIDTKKGSKKMIEILIEAGAFDFTTWSRSQLLASVEPMYLHAQKEQKEKARGELSLFSLLPEEKPLFSSPPQVPDSFTKAHRFQKEKELLGFYVTGHPLESEQALLSRLSCVPLDQLESLPHGASFRTAFVIETVTTKLASKSGRKFAILNIGDGTSCAELPIWADLYEEKQLLLQEGKLIYAVLQIEKENSTKLHCRWLGDLTEVNEEMIAAADLAYDKSRLRPLVKPSFKQGDKTEMKIETPVAPPSFERLYLKFDADRMRLSYILELKEIFRSHPGPTPIEIEFISTQASFSSLGILSIEGAWGIAFSQEFKEKLLTHPVLCPMEIACQ